MYIKLINTFWTAVLRQEVKSEKTLRFLEVSIRRVGTTHLVRRHLDISRQVNRAGILTGIIVPTKSDSDVIFCLQLLNQTSTCTHHLS